MTAENKTAAPSHIGEAAGMVAPNCQSCGGEIAGWLCQSCDKEFKENDAGKLVFTEDSDFAPAGMVAPAQSGWSDLSRQIDILRRAADVPAPDDDHDFSIENARRGADAWRTIARNVVAAYDAAPGSPAEKGEGELDADDLVSRLRGEPGDCAFCGRDPYHYVDNGVGMERVAVTCCDEGIALYQHGDEVLSRQVQLRYEAADEIERLSSLYTHPASDQSDTERMRAAISVMESTLKPLARAINQSGTRPNVRLSGTAAALIINASNKLRAALAEKEAGQ